MLEDELRRLRNELDETRRDLVGLMPDAITDVLLSYIRVESRDDSRVWEHEATDQIIEKAKPFNQGYERRAYCPLCKGSSSSPYSEGFTVPEGLKRHLTGFGNTNQCVVTKATFALARQRWHDLFAETEQKEWAAQAAQKTLRRTEETLYRTAPDLEPDLIDEGVYFGARDEAGIAWAEQRLSDLGFTALTEGRVKQYTLDRDIYVVYADPRHVGALNFTVFKKPLPKRARRLRVRFFPHFNLPDKWKNDIRGKFEKRLADALRSLK